MGNNFDLRKFLVENKLTTNSRLLKEQWTLKRGKKFQEITIGGKTYTVGDFDPNDDGRIKSIEKYPNGYAINGAVYSDYGSGDAPKEMYVYGLDLDGNEMDEEELEGRWVQTSDNGVNEYTDYDEYTDYEPGTIAPADLYFSDKHGKLVALDDVDDKYWDSLDGWLVVKKGDKVPDPMD